MTEDNTATPVEDAKDAPTTEEAEKGSALDRVVTLLEDQDKRDVEREDNIQKTVTDALERLNGDGDPSTKSKRIDDPLKGEVGNELDHRGYKRADYEMARMIMGGTGPRIGTAEVVPSEDFMAAYRAHVPEQEIGISDENGKWTRAMDTAETGFGLELIGAQYATSLWGAARNADSIVSSIRPVPLTAPNLTIPIDGPIP